MEKIIQSLINNWVRGVDTYTHNGSTWLIFTDSKRWVIELTDDKTLWYNYNFFKQIFEFTSLNVVDNQQYITKWVEDNIMNKVSDIHFRDARDRKQQFEYTLEKGVKKIRKAYMKTDWSVDDTIQNGVKETQFNSYENKSWVEGVIKGGVKETKSDDFNVSQFLCEEVIDKGVKETKQKDRARLILDIDGRGLILETDLVIRDGVKETNHVDVMKFFDNKMEDTLENGVRLTEYQIGDTFDGIDDIIENGVKETTALDPSFSVRYINGDFEMVPEVEKIIKNGVKYTFNTEYMPKSMVVDIIENGVKSSIPRQYVGENIIDKIIDKGVIETHREICEYKHTVEHIIQTGVKETKHANKYESIGPVIKEGKINHIIDNGVKVSGTFVGGTRQKENVESVIGYGTKNPTD